MGYASQAGRARTNPANPQAHAICDRCGFRCNHVDLRWQFDWRGAALTNVRILVCRTCYDNAQQQLRAIVIPADPVPITNPRTQEFVTPVSDFRTTTGQSAIDPYTGLTVPGGFLRVTSDAGDPTDDYRVTQQVGPTASALSEQPGLQQGAAMYSREIPIASMTANSTVYVTVVTSVAHGLVTGDQVSIEGSSLSKTDGFYNVIVVDATTFTYMVSIAIITGTAIFTPTTLLTATSVGTPYEMGIPQTGPL